MLHVGYTTPYRIVLLVLTRRLCKYDYPDDFISKFVVFLTKSILNEESIRETCSEPKLVDVYRKIKEFVDDESYIESTIVSIHNELISINNPHNFDTFIASLKELIDDGSDTEHNETVVLDKCSAFGLFVRRCRVEFAVLPFDQLSDIQRAFDEYIHNKSGDSVFLIKDQSRDIVNRPEGWVSDYNVKEFLKAQAEKIERTGTSNIHPTVLHNYLKKLDRQAPYILNILQVRYLNYTRSKYIQSLSHLHLFFDMSLDKGVDVQYALLNIGILEYKFGHTLNALSALNDALSAARLNKDDYCLQEVQYWIEVCRNNTPFDGNSSYTDDYLNNMKTLTRARNMLRDGGPCRYVFESLYKSSINIIMNDIKNMHRVQYLITSLAWQRYGNSVLAKSYLDLAENSGDESVEDIEKTVISHANMLQSLGDSDKALDVLTNFVTKYPNESDLLLGWRQAKARILRQSNKKRTFDMIQHQADMLHFAIPPYSEEYFNAVHDHAYQLMLNKEFEKALLVLDEVHDFIRKTDQTSQLGYNLLLQAVIHLQMNSVKTSIPILIEAMTLSKRSYDTKNYYSATIKLAEAYARMNDTELLKKSIFMLESIFPKVLVMKSKRLESDLYLTYAEALDTSSLSQSQTVFLDYINKAENGYRKLGLKDQLLRTLHFKTMILEKFKLPDQKLDTLTEIRNLQSSL